MVVAAILVIEILEVFEARMVCGAQMESKVEKMFLQS